MTPERHQRLCEEWLMLTAEWRALRRKPLWEIRPGCLMRMAAINRELADINRALAHRGAFDD